MQTVTIELTKSDSMEALVELERKQLIKIKKGYQINSFSIEGNSMSKTDFLNWIEYAESTPIVRKTEANQRWELQKKKLQKLTS